MPSAKSEFGFEVTNTPLLVLLGGTILTTVHTRRVEATECHGLPGNAVHFSEELLPLPLLVIECTVDKWRRGKQFLYPTKLPLSASSGRIMPCSQTKDGKENKFCPPFFGFTCYLLLRCNTAVTTPVAQLATV